MLLITIDRSRDEPVYEQVADQIRRLVATRALPPGTALPSVREIARDLGVGLNTVARAYRLLQADGFISIRNRSGVTVAEPAGEVESTTYEKLLGELRAILARFRQAGVTTDRLLQTIRDEVSAIGDRAQGGA